MARKQDRKNHQLQNQTSGKVEYYTPPHIIEAARAVLGWIDLDPFSCEAANQIVGAREYWTIQTEPDQFDRPWYGRVWMNHPFIRGFSGACLGKLVAEFEAGNVMAALCITYANTSEQYFQPLLRRPQCYLYPRTNYVDAQGNKIRGVTKGSVVTYFGPRLLAFEQAFSPLGAIMYPAPLATLWGSKPAGRPDED